MINRSQFSKASQKQKKLEKAFSNLNSISAWGQTQQIIVKYYVIKQPISVFIQNLNRSLIESFTQIYYHYLIYKCFTSIQQERYVFQIVKICVGLKEKYIELFNSIQNIKKRNSIIQYFFFLISLASEVLLNQIIEEKLQRIDRLRVSEFSYILLINQTLGLLISPSSYRLMKKKFIIKQCNQQNVITMDTSKTNFFPTSKSINNKIQKVDSIIGAGIRRKRILMNDQIQTFKQDLKQRLKIKGKMRVSKVVNFKIALNTPSLEKSVNYCLKSNSQKKTKIQRFSVDERLKQNKYRTQRLNSNQCSSSLGLKNQLSFQERVQSSDIKFYPIYTARFYQNKKQKRRNRAWDIELQRQRYSCLKKHLQKRKSFSRKLNTQGWINQVQKLRDRTNQITLYKLQNQLNQNQNQRFHINKTQRHKIRENGIQKIKDFNKRVTKCNYKTLIKLGSKQVSIFDKNPQIIQQKMSQKKEQIGQFQNIKAKNLEFGQNPDKQFIQRMKVNFDSAHLLKRSQKQFFSKYVNNEIRFQQFQYQNANKIHFSKRFSESYKFK